MINWEMRDKVLAAVYELNDNAPSAETIHTHLGDSQVTPDDVQDSLMWLADQGLLADKPARAWGGEVLRARISSLGVNYVETETSVQELAKAAVRGSIVNAQTNYNHGPSINNLGDKNVSTQNISGESELEKVIAALREVNEVDKADELQQEANENGTSAALKKAAGWIGTNAIAAPVIGKIAPFVFAALGV